MAGRKKPARVARAGAENVFCRAAIDTSGNAPPHPKFPTHQAAAEIARRLVAEMRAAGAVFTILRREGRPPTFVYTIRPGGSLGLCRNIIADVRACGAEHVFVAAIAEIEEAAR